MMDESEGSKPEASATDKARKVLGIEEKAEPKPEPSLTDKAREKVQAILEGAAQASEEPKAEPKPEQPKGNPKIDVEPPIYDPEDLTKAAGMVGALTDWITASALYPNRPLALGSALVAVGTLIGQRVAGPTRGATHLYVVGIGGTASGKQQGIDAGKDALNAAGAESRIGAGDFRSSVGFINQLKKQSAFCSFIDEYGLVLQRIVKKSAGGYELDLISVLQQLWGLNWTFYNSPEAARETSLRIFAPAFSIFGLTTPENFYGAVTLKQIAGGLLNRHLILRGEDRPPLQERTEGSWKVPAALAKRLRALYRPRSKPAVLKDVLDKKLDDPPFEPEIMLDWGSADAKQIWVDLTVELRKDPNELRRNLFARVPEMVVRIATIVAFGRGSFVVDEIDMQWARALALQSAETLHEGVLKFTVDPQSFAGLCQKILDLAAEEGGWISRRDLKRRCTTLIAKAGELDVAIKHLIEAERIREVTRPAGPKGGRPSQGYELCA